MSGWDPSKVVWHVWDRGGYKGPLPPRDPFAEKLDELEDPDGERKRRIEDELALGLDL